MVSQCAHSGQNEETGLRPGALKRLNWIFVVANESLQVLRGVPIRTIELAAWW